MKCKRCDATLDLTMTACPACGAEVELGRLTGILGIVCRACDAYNEPRAKTCVGCGKPLGEPERAEEVSPVVRAFPKPGAGAPTRVVPAILRPSAAKGPAEPPAVTPTPLVTTCPGCGAEAASGRFCAQCGHALPVRGTQVVIKAIPHGARAATAVFGVPSRAALVLEAGEGSAGRSFRLDGGPVEAGRSQGAIVFPDDPCLAAHHATFVQRGGRVRVRDEGAPGGVLVRVRAAVQLRPGDQFAVGDRLLRYAGPLPAQAPDAADGTRRLGAPRPGAPAVVVEECLEGGGAGRTFVRAGPDLTIGRAGCTVSLGDDPRLSEIHAELHVETTGNALLRDLGSATGTFVKLPPRAERELQDGDRVRIGREVLRVALG